MAYKIQSSFSAGELDPALWERTTLDKYRTGLRTLRNAVIGKTGRIISAPGRKFYSTTREVTCSAGTFTADAGTDIFTKVDHFLHTGAAVQVSSTTTLPAGLAAATTYYAIYLTEDTFQLATTLDRALQGWFINVTSAGSGTHTLTPTVTGTYDKVVFHAPPFSNYLLEFGHCYTRIHNTSTGVVTDGTGHGFSEDDLENLQFDTSPPYTYISCYGKPFRKIVTSTGTLLSHVGDTIYTQGAIYTPDNLNYVSSTLTGAGSAVEYQFTYVDSYGQESSATFTTFAASLPVSSGTSNTYVFQVPTTDVAVEIRAYRRPTSGNAFGYIGSSTTKSLVGSNYQFTFIDYGADADYTHSPPASVVEQQDWIAGGTIFPTISTVGNLRSRAVAIFQQRLILGSSLNEEAIFTSRPEYPHDFTRDYPLNSDSALKFKCGTSGGAKVLRFKDVGRLAAFTTQGIYVSESGALTPTNIAMDRRGPWVINEKVEPLEIPGALLIVEKSTGVIIAINYSEENISYIGDEISIYSNHLFEGKQVVSWAYQKGRIPLIWIVMDDGSLVVLTWQKEQLMTAWSRHDSLGLYEQVCVVNDDEGGSRVYFIVNQNGQRNIEYLADRYVADLKDYVGMHSAVTYKTALTGTITVTPVVADTWDGSLTLTASVASFSNTSGNGAIGSVFKFFDSEGSSISLTVTAYTSTTVVTVTPSSTYPEDEATAQTMYKTFTTLTGLDHLEGLDVSVLADGYVAASPNNTLAGYTTLTVTGGQITLPDPYENSAIVQVGLPYSVDIEPLDVDTVEQKPSLLESCLNNRLNIALYKSRGLYAAAEFPNDDSNTDMVDLEERLTDIEEDLLGNRCQQPYTRRIEFDIPGDWESQGRVCLRQVDPLPVEILSLIPDLEIYRS